MVLLGVRAKGAAPGFHVLGRETFLAPVEWVDGWPVPGALRLSPAETEPAVRYDFDEDLGPEWVSLRRRPDTCSTVRSGQLVVDDGGLVLRRQQHQFVRVRALLERGSAAEAGLTVFLEEEHRYDVVLAGDRIVATAKAGGLGTTAEAPAPDRAVVLVVETRPHPSGPDAVVLGFEDEAGELQVLSELDGRYLSTEVVGGFTGRFFGMFANGGDAAFAWFDYEPLPG